ncbi:hypothetical protein GCM10010515_71980 [Streptomyces fructofermentans]|uniref:Uncharacterized protein n=1 Tax=Streptomyces fructofermentans TaxID=152141 RepID=A0A918NTG1_9ACTN|nr:hypothetical protein GCM10010515_71980 [Streptomyces fructofermentans]
MGARVPEGYHRVRGHVRRNPRARAGKLGGWTVAGLVAGVWLWGQVFGFDGAAATVEEAPQPSVSVSAGR